jgi:Acetyltransferase (GNAT) domain
MLSGEGPFHQLLVDESRSSSRFVFRDDAYTRAFLRRHRDGEAYLQASVKGHHRRKMKRLERMLAETGTVDYAALSATAEVEPWLQAFLRMEAASWKGREGTALACEPADERYFLEIGREAQRRGRLLMFALRLDGEPIALNSYFRAGDGCFYFKPSFVEQHAKFSPGRLLEMETIHRFHGSDGIAWADSCTATDNELLNALWLERRTITSLYVSSGRAGGDLLVALLPIMRWMNQQLRRHRAWIQRSRRRSQ